MILIFYQALLKLISKRWRQEDEKPNFFVLNRKQETSWLSCMQNETVRQILEFVHNKAPSFSVGVTDDGNDALDCNILEGKFEILREITIPDHLCTGRSFKDVKHYYDSLRRVGKIQWNCRERIIFTIYYWSVFYNTRWLNHGLTWMILNDLLVMWFCCKWMNILFTFYHLRINCEWTTCWRVKIWYLKMKWRIL